MKATIAIQDASTDFQFKTIKTIEADTLTKLKREASKNKVKGNLFLTLENGTVYMKNGQALSWTKF